MAKDLEKALVNNPEAKLRGTEKTHMDLGGHLEYIESLLAEGTGGKSIPPILNLLNFETMEARTTITEEEKTNLENGLYNQVFFPGLISDSDELQLFMPSKLMSDKLFGANMFAQFNCVVSGDLIINALSVYRYSFGAKDTSGNYPITIEKQMDIPIGDSGGSNVIVTFEN